MQSNQNEAEKRFAPFAVFALIASLVMINVAGQVSKDRRGGGGITRGTAVRGEEDKEEAAGRRGVVVKEDEAYAAAGRQGAVVGKESYQAAGRCGVAAGAIIPVLPRNCVSARVGNVSYQNCGGTYYQPVSNGYQVVVIR